MTSTTYNHYTEVKIRLKSIMRSYMQGYINFDQMLRAKVDLRKANSFVRLPAKYKSDLESYARGLIEFFSTDGLLWIFEYKGLIYSDFDYIVKQRNFDNDLVHGFHVYKEHFIEGELKAHCDADLDKVLLPSHKTSYKKRLLKIKKVYYEYR